MKARIYVTLKPSVLDPQGKAVLGSLHSLGYNEAADARIGKLIELTLEGNDRKALEERVGQMCEKLLANTVIENYSFELIEEAGG